MSAPPRTYNKRGPSCSICRLRDCFQSEPWRFAAEKTAPYSRQEEDNPLHPGPIGSRTTHWPGSIGPRLLHGQCERICPPAHVALLGQGQGIAPDTLSTV